LIEEYSLYQVSTVEWETQQASVLEGLRAGNAALDALHKVLRILKNRHDIYLIHMLYF
jgi:hypothetical protein